MAKGRKYRLVIAKPDKSKRSLTCDIWDSQLSWCPPYKPKSKDYTAFYKNKEVFVRYNKDYGTVYELIVDDEKLLSYEEQKLKYQSRKSGFFPIGTTLAVIFLWSAISIATGMITIQRKEN